jgi:hypothetical protein
LFLLVGEILKCTDENHASTIKSLIITMRASLTMHALIVEGPAGWGKTTAVDSALNQAGIRASYLGSYSTPLHLFNFLYEHSNDCIVIDDTAGLFCESSSMAILKAATWPRGNQRTIRWGSSTSKAITEEFTFQGKLIIVCNTFPATADAEAIKSRSFPFKVRLNAVRAKELLEIAAKDESLFKDTKSALAVAEYLGSCLTGNSLSTISFRTLQMGYELAQHNPNDWQKLLSGMVMTTASEDPRQVVIDLARQRLKVKDQARIFEDSTGFKRRTFFKLRRELSLSDK